MQGVRTDAYPPPKAKASLQNWRLERPGGKHLLGSQEVAGPRYSNEYPAAGLALPESRSHHRRGPLESRAVFNTVHGRDAAFACGCWTVTRGSMQLRTNP